MLHPILVFQLKYDEGHIERFAFYVNVHVLNTNIYQYNATVCLYKFFLVNIYAGTVS